jgi:hypothetical protein
MADALKEILSKLQAISTYADLKAIRVEVQRRERELDAQRAAQFEAEAEVCISNRGRAIFGVVQIVVLQQAIHRGLRDKIAFRVGKARGQLPWR